MFKKLFAALTLLIALPAFANAAVWTVKATSANPTFGTVSPAGYTNNADTTLSQTITVTPGANYQISSIMVDNVNKGTSSPVVVPKKAGTTIVVASFAARSFTVKAGACTNGSISSSTTSTVNAGGSKSFTVTPFSGYKILAVADNGTPVTLDASNVYTVTNVQANHTITATFGGVTANAGLNQTAVVGGTVALNGSGTVPAGDTASYQWTVTYAPVGSAITTATVFNTAAASFPADKAGTYNLKLKVSAGALSATSTVAVTAFADAAAAAVASANACASCHAANSAYFTSPHAVTANASFATQTTAVGCVTCHATGQFNGTTVQNATLLGMDAPVPTAATTCQVCHADSIQAANWTKSSHNIANNGFKAVTCVECHDPHSSVATATDDKTDSCSKCHVRYSTAANYGLYSSNGTMRTPHGQGVPAYMGGTGGAGDNASKGWPAAQTSYLTRGAICTDCHGHNNTINAGFAEGGHGKVSSDPMNPFNHYDWSKQTNNGTRQNGNCDRCHTAAGFMKLLGATSDPAYARLNAGLTQFASYTSTKITKYQANNVLICVGCHTTTEGGLRTDATPAGNGGPLSGGYFALFSTSKSYGTSGISTSIGAVAPGKTKVQIQFPGYKNSSICVPCHSGRSTDQVFVNVIAKAKADLKNYSTVPTSYYQHAANMGQTFIGKGAYDFSGKLATIGASKHEAVKNGASDTQGPCVGCHYSSDKSHSLEVAGYATCQTCHGSSWGAASVDTAKTNFAAGVKALDEIVRVKLNPLRIDTTLDLSAERANLRFGRFGKAAGVGADDQTATRAYGAWYNWQILATYDQAAFVHNPAYAKQLLADTIDYLDDGILNASSTAAINATTTLSADEKTAANNVVAYASVQKGNPGIAAATGYVGSKACSGCHADTFASWSKTLHNKPLKQLSETGDSVLVNKTINPAQDDFVTGLDFNTVTTLLNKSGASYANPFNARKPNAPILGMDASGRYIQIGAVKYYVTRAHGGNGKWKQRYQTKIGNAYYVLNVMYQEGDGTYAEYNGQNWYGVPPVTARAAWNLAGVNAYTPIFSIAGDNTNPALLGDVKTKMMTAYGNNSEGGPSNSSWDNRCTGCHQTGMQLEYNGDATSGEVVAGYVELNIGCEACHGPAAAHAAAPSAGNILNPQKAFVASATPDYFKANEVCGQCHNRTEGAGKLGANGTTNLVNLPTESPSAENVEDRTKATFYNTNSTDRLNNFVEKYDPGTYGNINNGGLALGGLEYDGQNFPKFAASNKHHQTFLEMEQGKHGAIYNQTANKGLSCWSCHDPHAANSSNVKSSINGVATNKDDNSLCLACHNSSSLDASSADFAGLAKTDIGNVTAELAAVNAHLTSKLSHTITAAEYQQSITATGTTFGAFGNNTIKVGNCISCHMPLTVTSGIKRTPSGTAGRKVGDVHNHTMKTVKASDVNTTVVTGGAVNGKAGAATAAGTGIVTSCSACHISPDLPGWL